MDLYFFLDCKFNCSFKLHNACCLGHNTKYIRVCELVVIIGRCPVSLSALSWPTVTLAMFGKFCLSIGFSIVYMFTAELYPTAVRNIGVGCASFSARIGGMLAPIISQLVRFRSLYHISSTILNCMNLDLTLKLYCQYMNEDVSSEDMNILTCHHTPMISDCRKYSR